MAIATSLSPTTRLPTCSSKTKATAPSKTSLSSPGVAYNGDGDVEAGMGVDFGDYDQDGDPDLYVTHFFTETNTLYRNEGGVRFSDVTTTAGLAVPTVEMLGWGTRFFRLRQRRPPRPLRRQRPRISTGRSSRNRHHLPSAQPTLRNEGDGRFTPVSAGLELTQAKVSRGTSFGDYDDDGDIDLFVVELNDAPTLLRNDGEDASNYLVLQVFGREDNRNGVGTRIGLQAAGKHQWRTVNGAGSYLSHSDLRVHFGLGAAQAIDRVEITYPNGSTYAIENVPANKLLVVRKGRDTPLHELGANPFNDQPRCARPAPARFRVRRSCAAENSGWSLRSCSKTAAALLT